MGARLRCASLTMRTICASSVSLPTRSARMTKLPVPLTVPPVTLIAGRLLDRHRLARNHGFIDRARSFEHHAIHRNFLARPHAQTVADLHLVERNVLLAAVASGPRALSSAPGPAARGCALDVWLRARSSSTCPSSTSVVITAAGSKYTATVPPCPRKESGKIPGSNGRNHAVEIGRARAHGDQREHIWTAVDDRCPAALKERPAAPQHHRRRQRKLDPDCEPSRTTLHCAALPAIISPMAIEQNRRGQRQADPEAPRHVGSSGFAPPPDVTVRGSSAMPQIGQAPGPSRTTSGCIGQVYVALAVTGGAGIGSATACSPVYFSGFDWNRSRQWTLQKYRVFPPYAYAAAACAGSTAMPQTGSLAC